MFRATLLAVALAAGAAPATAGRIPAGVPHNFVPVQSGVEGRWFMRGSPLEPCYIEVVPTPRGPMLILTNERGEQSRGRFLPGNRIIADDWSGGLIGDVRGNEIFWRNGDRWAR